jgi:hypothetical protein
MGRPVQSLPPTQRPAATSRRSSTRGRLLPFDRRRHRGQTGRIPIPLNPWRFSPHREEVHPQRRLAAAPGGGFEVELAVQPHAGPVGEGDPHALGVDGGAVEHRGGDRAQLGLGVGLLLEVPCVLLARRVAVAGPPATVGPPREADHPQPRPPATWPPKRRVGPQPREEKCDGAVRTESARVPSPTILSNSRSTTPNVLATTPPLTSPEPSGQRQPSEQPECLFQDGGKIVRRPGSQSAGSGFESLMAHPH